MASNSCRLKAAGSPRHKALSLPDINVPTSEQVRTTDYRNVYWAKVKGKWQAQRHVNGKKVNLGLFDDPREAFIAVLLSEKADPPQDRGKWCQAAKAYGESKYKGVTRCASGTNPWRAEIRCGKQRYHIGHFKTPEEAARAYDKKCLELRGPDCRLNFPI